MGKKTSPETTHVSKVKIGYNEMGSKQMPYEERIKDDMKHHEIKRSYQYPETFVFPKK